VRYEVRSDLGDGEHQIPVAAVINRDTRFDGLTVGNSQPSLITVLVDPIVVETAVPVRIRNDDKEKGLFSDPSFTPATVRVRLPRRVRDAAKAANNGQLIAFADFASLADKTPGRKADVPGVKVFVEGVSLDELIVDPPTVTASVTIGEQSIAEEIDLAVWQSMPPPSGSDEPLSVDYDPRVVTGVRIFGKPEIVQKLKSATPAALNAMGARAEVLIEAGDIGAQRKKKEIRITLPEGVKVHADYKPPTVDLTVTKRPK
jgi:hypothetical protein